MHAIVTSTTVMKDLPQLAQFCHTGEIEVFHNMLLKYCSKRQHFGYDGMKARLQLAALDWNSQSRRAVQDGDGEVVLDRVYSKRRKQWVLKTRYKNTSKMAHVHPLMKRIEEVETSKLRHELPQADKPENLPKNIAPVPKPDLAKMQKTTRFNTK